MAIFSLQNGADPHDEVSFFQLGRYISTNEAIWRIFSFPIHERHPTVVHLSVHLENGQRVYFTEENAINRVQNPRDTTLTAFFKLCREDVFAKTLFYHQVPSFYSWNDGNKAWSRRKNGRQHTEFPGIKKSDVLGRVYTVHPRNEESFYLRMLLHEIKGPVSFAHLKTVENTVCDTYKQACQARNLLEDDDHWRDTLIEAQMTRTPRLIRELFAILLHHCSVSNPLDLWNTFKECMAEDFMHRLTEIDPDRELTDVVYNHTLLDIEDRLIKMGSHGLEQWHLPKPDRNADVSIDAVSTVNENAKIVREREPKLTDDQRYAYDRIVTDVTSSMGGIYFLDAPGGTGKTFLLNLILAKIKLRNITTITVASSGIAATLLSGGRTAHSTFKLPLDLQLEENPICNMSRGTPEANALQTCGLIVWDECTMSHKGAIEAVDKSLKEFRQSRKAMSS